VWLSGAIVAPVVAALGVVATAGPAAADAPELGTVPVSAAAAQDAPDPEVLVAGAEWVLYSTNTVVGGDDRNVPVWRSTDGGTTWVPVGDALPELGAWARRGWTWAPAVDRRPDGTHALYYTARNRASDRQCIGVATSAAATGPFTDARGTPLVCQVAEGGSIDADVHVAAGGIRYLVWKSDSNHPEVALPPDLWSRRLAPSGTELAGTSAWLVRGGLGGEGVVEGPSMFDLVRPAGPAGGEGGPIGLLYSAGWWETLGYRMRLARCAAPQGPCALSTWDPPLARAGGGGSVFTDAAGRHHVAYHHWVGPPGYLQGGVRATAVAALDPVLPGVDGPS
jgi:hypothetical protein